MRKRIEPTQEIITYDQARKQNLYFYYIPVTCELGHDSPKETKSGICLTCMQYFGIKTNRELQIAIRKWKATGNISPKRRVRDQRKSIRDREEKKQELQKIEDEKSKRLRQKEYQQNYYQLQQLKKYPELPIFIAIFLFVKKRDHILQNCTPIKRHISGIPITQKITKKLHLRILKRNKRLNQKIQDYVDRKKRLCEIENDTTSYKTKVIGAYQYRTHLLNKAVDDIYDSHLDISSELDQIVYGNNFKASFMLDLDVEKYLDSYEYHMDEYY